MTFFPEAQRQGNSHLSNFVLKIKTTRLIPKYIFIKHIVSQSFQVFSGQVCGLKIFIMSRVQSLTHPTPKLFCYKFWAMSQANGSSYWAALTGRPTGRPWVKKPTHSPFHWAIGLPISLVGQRATGPAHGSWYLTTLTEHYILKFVTA